MDQQDHAPVTGGRATNAQSNNQVREPGKKESGPQKVQAPSALRNMLTLKSENIRQG